MKALTVDIQGRGYQVHIRKSKRRRAQNSSRARFPEMSDDSKIL